MFVFFFFNDTATTEIYTLSLHDALPISVQVHTLSNERGPVRPTGSPPRRASSFAQVDRKSTRLNSSHQIISYAVFCLKKKNESQPLSSRNRERPDRICPSTPSPHATPTR